MPPPQIPPLPAIPGPRQQFTNRLPPPGMGAHGENRFVDAPQAAWAARMTVVSPLNEVFLYRPTVAKGLVGNGSPPLYPQPPKAGPPPHKCAAPMPCQKRASGQIIPRLTLLWNYLGRFWNPDFRARPKPEGIASPNERIGELPIWCGSPPKTAPRPSNAGESSINPPNSHWGQGHREPNTRHFGKPIVRAPFLAQSCPGANVGCWRLVPEFFSKRPRAC